MQRDDRARESLPSGDADPERETPVAPRPLIERVGLGLIALVLAIAFGGIAALAWLGGEVFLAVMAGIGALMTVWAAASSLRRG
jgi:hypothetical protein